MQSTFTQSHVWQPMSFENMERRWAVYFYEGSGYYYLADAISSTGSTAVMMLVTADETHEVFIRKLHDVQVHNPEEHIQCSDIRNQLWNFDPNDDTTQSGYNESPYTFSHKSIPKCVCSHDWKTDLVGEAVDDYGNPEWRDFKYVQPATTWQFCNAGSLGEYHEDWVNNYGTERFPEAFIWEFIYRIGTALLDSQKMRVAHRDVHVYNVVLDWPDSATIPMPYLIDFGYAIRLPWNVQDPRFQNAFDDTLRHQHGSLFDGNGCVISNVLSREDMDSLNAFYLSASADLEDFAVIVQELILRFRAPGRQTAADLDRFAGEYIHQTVQNGSGTEGYSFLLIRALSLLINLIRNSKNAYQRHFDLRDFITNEVMPQRAPSKAAYDADPNQRAFLNGWVGLQVRSKRQPPLVWKDWRSIYKAANPHNERFNPNDIALGRARGEDLFYHYRELNYSDRPLVEITHPDLGESIYLKLDQFKIVEGFWDEATQTFHFDSYVEPMEHPPAPWRGSTDSHSSDHQGNNIDNGDDNDDDCDGSEQTLGRSNTDSMDIETNHDGSTNNTNIQSSIPQHVRSGRQYISPVVVTNFPPSQMSLDLPVRPIPAQDPNNIEDEETYEARRLHIPWRTRGAFEG